MNKKIYCFDIDGVVCDTANGDYENAVPKMDRIKRINKLHKNGNTVIFFTSRGKLSGIDWSDLTHRQFKKWKLKYHNILFGKPYFDTFIDDKAVNDKDFFELA